MTMTTPALERRSWSDPAPHRPVPFWAAVRQDIVAHIAPEHRRCSRARWAWMGLGVALRSSSFHATCLYRLSHTMRHRGWLPGRLLASVLGWTLRHGYGCTIPSTARLHGGLILPHPQGIVIGPSVAVGPRAWIFQHATLGGAPGKVGMPAVGADVRIFTGAVLSGPIQVGDEAVIGANAVVSRDVPARTAVRCAPPEFRPCTSPDADQNSS